MNQQIEIKVGDVFVRDVGDGFYRYLVVTGASDSGVHIGVSFLVNPDGYMFSLSIEGCITEHDLKRDSRYGTPVPVADDTPAPVAS